MTTSPIPDRSDSERKPGWQAWQFGGHPCHVFHPTTVHEHEFLLIFLHDQDRSLPTTYQGLFEKHGLRVIVPEGNCCWWSDRETDQFAYTTPAGEKQTAEQFVCQTLLTEIQSTFGVAPPQVGLFGIGMGGQGALRISYRHPNQFPVVAGVAADLDFHQRIKEGDEVLFDIYGDTESGRQDTAILHIHPLNWPRHQFFCADPNDMRTFESADRLRMKMASIGIMFESDLKTGPPKGVKYADHMSTQVIEFLLERLNKERLRIV